MHWSVFGNISVSLLSSETSQSPVVEAGGSHDHMTPEEHYRRMMSALSEQGSYEEQQQRLYQLASSMGLSGHGQSTDCVCVYVCVYTRYIQYISTFRIALPHSFSENPLMKDLDSVE